MRNVDASRVDLYQRPTLSLTILLLPLAILALASYVLALPSISPTIGGIAKVVAAFTGLCIVGLFLPTYVIFALSFRQPILTIANGALRLMRMTIYWQDISGIQTQRYAGRARVALRLRDPEGFLASVPNYVSAFYHPQLSRANNSILVPSVRGYSDDELVSLLHRWWIERKDYQNVTNSEGMRPYDSLTATESAAAIGTAVFGIALFPPWLVLIDCIRTGNLMCVLLHLTYAIAAGFGAYILVWIILLKIGKAVPGFDLWQKLRSFRETVLAGISSKPRR